ncbi:MAG: hypothetical protein V1754_10075, partial [Pseudomonadota bacterium]
EDFGRAVELAKSFGMEVGAFVCIGNYGETKEEIEQSIQLVCNLHIDKCQFTLVTPYPGSQLYSFLKKKNLLLVDDWDRYSPYENEVFFETPELSKEEVLASYRRAFRRFYLRPSYVAKSLVSINTYRNLPIILREIRQFLF